MARGRNRAQNGHSVMSELLSPVSDHQWRTSNIPGRSLVHVSGLSLYGGSQAHRAGVRGPAACRCIQATLPGKAHDPPVSAIARPLPCPNNQRRPHAWLYNSVPMQPLEAGMMNPRRLSIVPAPSLRSVILATGVVGLLATFGPAGNPEHRRGATQRHQRSLSLHRPGTRLAPQPSSMLNDDSRSNRCSGYSAIACGSSRRRINRSEQAGAGCRNGPDQFAGCAANRTSACASRNGESVGSRAWRRPQGRSSIEISMSAWWWTPASIDTCGRFTNELPRRTASRCPSAGK